MKHSLIQRFKDFITTEDLFKKDSSLLIAVSGGVDSVVLCALCYECGFTFSIAHCNFKLRDKESEEDAAFVQALAIKYGVPFFEKEFDTAGFAAGHKFSIQVAARKLRYDWFNKLMNSGEQHYDVLLTAHHADDNTETIMMNFFKGTGIKGLKGIMPKQENIIRPLLFASKEDLQTFAIENNLKFREDSSNLSDKYTRNYFRNELIPGIEKVFPAVKNNLLENADRFRDINIIYEAALKNIFKKIVKKEGSEMHIPVLLLYKTPGYKTILYEIIKEYGFTSSQAQEAARLLLSESGKYLQSGTHRILRNRKWLIISSLGNINNAHYLLEAGNNELIFQGGLLKTERCTLPVNIDTNPGVAQLDMALVKFPLIVRKWKKGDYFYPLGMVKKKKLSRFFIDIKLSLNQKEDTWVIESDKKIIWIIGHRIDNRFRVSGTTKNLLKIYWLPSK